ncbi:MlaC/ttg2D family ABC transporter substrate-binding protein [Microbulbifer pacificus]|uniref:ABC transporter substrate-binding protein n=1 Tax=Microbulbifer pacificus TaxID=407164 RepID=A0AAU0N0J2_9GAMM|nr:ABC transporter substrate-binding protein [Microbulbifer pacificus]WOX06472.1 ABC transporter substrate-binding protein [Microbulbifer pacificus]
MSALTMTIKTGAFQSAIARKARALLSTVLLCSLAPFAGAAENPYTMIESVSTELLDVVRSEGQLVSSNPQRYYASIDRVLAPVVDFDFIAMGVMADYAKQATPAQRAKFTSAFRRDLVATFARGVASFGSMDVKVVNPGSVPKGGKVNVLQEVRSSEGLTKVAYTMARKKNGQWKLINVVLNGVNLGKTFRGQFSQAMQTNKGDLDKVIANWSAADKVADEMQ